MKFFLLAFSAFLLRGTIALAIPFAVNTTAGGSAARYQDVDNTIQPSTNATNSTVLNGPSPYINFLDVLTEGVHRAMHKHRDARLIFTQAKWHHLHGAQTKAFIILLGRWTRRRARTAQLATRCSLKTYHGAQTLSRLLEAGCK